ncbi:MAG TPA: hypothetical protein VNE67_09230 [Acetobacteraceae bacterium]|nr:hypothetical protein [Acetobacteraceae bacterium]
MRVSIAPADGGWLVEAVGPDGFRRLCTSLEELAAALRRAGLPVTVGIAPEIADPHPSASLYDDSPSDMEPDYRPAGAAPMREPAHNFLHGAGRAR